MKKKFEIQILSTLIAGFFITSVHSEPTTGQLSSGCNKQLLQYENTSEMIVSEQKMLALRNGIEDCQNFDGRLKLDGIWNINVGPDYTFSRDSIGGESDDISTLGYKALIQYKKVDLGNHWQLDTDVSYRGLDESVLDDNDESSVSVGFFRSAQKDFLYDELYTPEGLNFGAIFNYRNTDFDEEDFDSRSLDLRGIYFRELGKGNRLKISSGLKGIDSDRGYEHGIDGYVDFELGYFNPDVHYSEDEKITIPSWYPNGYERIFPRVYLSSHSGQEDGLESTSQMSVQGQWRWWWSMQDNLFFNIGITAGVDRIENYLGEDNTLTSAFIMPVFYINYNSSNTGGGGSGGSSGGNWYRP